MIKCMSPATVLPLKYNLSRYICNIGLVVYKIGAKQQHIFGHVNSFSAFSLLSSYDLLLFLLMKS